MTPSTIRIGAQAHSRFEPKGSGEAKITTRKTVRTSQPASHDASSRGTPARRTVLLFRTRAGAPPSGPGAHSLLTLWMMAASSCGAPGTSRRNQVRIAWSAAECVT